MTRGEVLFNYNQAMAQARRLDALAKQVELLSRNKIEDTKSRLRVAWQSDNSSAYLGKVEIVQNSIYDSAKKIRNIAQGIRTIAESVKAAELRAIEIARARNSATANLSKTIATSKTRDITPRSGGGTGGRSSKSW